MREIILARIEFQAATRGNVPPPFDLPSITLLRGPVPIILVAISVGETSKFALEDVERFAADRRIKSWFPMHDTDTARSGLIESVER